jgi:tetratricopeptide (TPR) repeat protein
MAIFQGLYLFEILLLVFGSLLFLVLLFALIYCFAQSKPIKRLLPFFVASIVMIAFPGIKSFQYKDGMISIETNESKLRLNADDPQARESLRKGLDVVQGRPNSDPRSSLVIARAHYALGNEQAALASLQPALRSQTAGAEALSLQKKIEALQTINSLTTKVEQNPGDASVKDQLASQLAQVAHEPIANPEAIARVARAQAALGQKEQAVANAQKALKINPNLIAAPQLRAIVQSHQ